MVKGFCLHSFDCQVPRCLVWGLVSTSPSIWRWAIFPLACVGGSSSGLHWKGCRQLQLLVTDWWGYPWEFGGSPPEENNHLKFCGRLTGTHSLASESESGEVAGASAHDQAVLPHSGPHPSLLGPLQYLCNLGRRALL